MSNSITPCVRPSIFSTNVLKADFRRPRNSRSAYKQEKYKIVG